MKTWIVIVVCSACGGSTPKPAPEPELPPTRTIDCAKLTDHVIEAQLVGSADSKEDLAGRRAKLLADCPAQWHADHPSVDELTRADCIMAAKSAPEINECVGLPPDPILHVPKSGIAACDDYTVRVESILHCSQVAQSTRDQIRDQFTKATSGWGSIPDDAKAKLAQDCGTGVAQIKQIASSMKCDR